jgi:hypothetical protein
VGWHDTLATTCWLYWSASWEQALKVMPNEHYRTQIAVVCVSGTNLHFNFKQYQKDLVKKKLFSQLISFYKILSNIYSVFFTKRFSLMRSQRGQTHIYSIQRYNAEFYVISHTQQIFNTANGTKWCISLDYIQQFFHYFRFMCVSPFAVSKMSAVD